MIEPHGGNTANFARYKGNVVGSTAVPNSAFQDFWNRVATLYVSNANVVYGLSNEPNNMGTVQWFSAAQAAINGIRVAGSNQMIMVPGNDYTASVTWTSIWYDTASPQVSNATAWLTLKDPVNNLVASVHTYFDANVSGSANDIVSATVGVDRLTDIVAWARTNKVKLHVSEYGVSETNSLAQPATTNLLNYIKTNSDVIIGSSWWTYGPPSWWGSYAFTLCPTNNYATDNVKMAWLTPYFTGQTVQTTIPKVVDASVVEASVDSGQVVDASVDAGFDSGKDASVVVDAGVVLFDAGLDASVDAGKPSLVYSDKVFYTIPGSYCKDFTLANNSSVPLSWTSMQLNMRGGTINTKNGALDLWNVSVSAPTGVITVKPIAIYKTIAPGKSLTFGFCSSYGSLNWTATQVVGSLVQP
jgi:hypothetical protein